MSIRRLSSSEFEEIAFKLETHHSIFYKLWEMGEMVFDEDIPTQLLSLIVQVIMFRFILILSFGNLKLHMNDCLLFATNACTFG